MRDAGFIRLTLVVGHQSSVRGRDSSASKHKVDIIRGRGFATLIRLDASVDYVLL